MFLSVWQARANLQLPCPEAGGNQSAEAGCQPIEALCEDIIEYAIVSLREEVSKDGVQCELINIDSACRTGLFPSLLICHFLSLKLIPVVGPVVGER